MMNNTLIDYENKCNIAELAKCFEHGQHNAIKERDKAKKTLNQHLAMGWDARMRVLEMKKETRALQVLVMYSVCREITVPRDEKLSRILRRLKQAKALVNPYNK